MPRRGVYGLTLIEIITVVAIMLLLASIAYPTFVASISYAHRVSCASNLEAIAQSVEMQRQEDKSYPGMPGFVGPGGIPLGGVTGMSQGDKNAATAEYNWCHIDSYPKLFPENLWSTPDAQRANGLLRDATASSYDDGYNYYGYVATTEGQPFPVTTLQAAQYFFGDPRGLEKTLDSYIYDRFYNYRISVKGEPPSIASTNARKATDIYLGWDLGLISTSSIMRAGTSTTIIRPHGLLQGLWNTWAPQSTIVTFCPHHIDSEGKGLIPAVLLNGAAAFYTPVQPMIADNAKMAWSSSVERKVDPGIDQNSIPPNWQLPTIPIDWRLNKIPLTPDPATGSLLGDSPYKATLKSMPVVQAIARRIVATDLSTANPWYDTSIPVQAHDVIMVVAHAKWHGAGFNPSADAAYSNLMNPQAQVWFTADGDPVEAASAGGSASNLLPGHPSGRLLGSIAGGGTVFPLGCRGSYIVPIGVTGNLLLTMNDAAGSIGNIAGWCELRVAVFRP